MSESMEQVQQPAGGCCGGGCCGGGQAEASALGAEALQLQTQQQQAQQESERRETKAPAATGVHIEPGAAVPSATPAAQTGPEHVEEPVAYDGILLSGFGGPEGQDDVIPFLRNVTRGRGIPDERLEEVSTHYRHFGGVSPINQQNRDLKAAFEAALADAGVDLPVYWGNRNWAPYLDEALQEAADAGASKLLAIPTSAYSSYSSCRQYREDWADALEATGLQASMQIDKVRQFFNHPGFLATFVDGVRATVAEARAAGFADAEVEVLFATHSIPTADAERSGAPDLHQWGPGGGYEGQHLAAAEWVMAEAAPGVAWQLVYQSRSGPASQPWLEPDINDAIDELAEASKQAGGEGGRKAIVIVPLGFVSDHMEVMWDLDEEAIETATEAGLWARRAPTPGIDPQYVGALVDLVQERLEGRPVADRKAVTSIHTWYDVCRPGCCENPRLGFRPAIAGLQP
ncbi:ferrochelatase [Agrococcus sp. Marseille-P2731]|uniref:ferrochelatase n=1 Tax=Agrococcus sp. Marseille-P2731 TaxID=1841862 RepID=UPI000A7EB438|nr:ferrochelatase [Agrococcus sp. Marseille-P2731]